MNIFVESFQNTFLKVEFLIIFKRLIQFGGGRSQNERINMKGLENLVEMKVKKMHLIFLFDIKKIRLFKLIIQIHLEKKCSSVYNVLTC